MNIKSILSYVGSVFLCLIFNCIVSPLIFPSPLYFRPDIVVSITVAVAIVSGSVTGGIYGLCVGLLLDTLFSRYLGLYALGYMMVGLISGFFSKQYYAKNLIFPTIIAFLMALLKEGLLAMQMRIAGAIFTGSGTALLRYLLPSAIITAVLTIPIYYIYQRSHRDDIRRSRWNSYLS